MLKEKEKVRAAANSEYLKFPVYFAFSELRYALIHQTQASSTVSILHRKFLWIRYSSHISMLTYLPIISRNIVEKFEYLPFFVFIAFPFKFPSIFWQRGRSIFFIELGHWLD